MLKPIFDVLTGAFKTKAPKAFPRGLSPMHYRPSQAANLDVDLVVGAISSAQNGDITPLLSLYRDIESSDGTIQSAIATRKLAVVARGYTAYAAANSGEAGQHVADQVQAMLDRSDSFLDACTWWLHGCIWPVSVVNHKWVPGGWEGGAGYSHPEFRNVPLELFDYRERTLRIRDVGETGNPLETSHTPTSQQYIVHRGHMLMAPDTWGGPLRALVFWYLFSTQDREWWARFLERFGAPFLIGRYDRNDDDSRAMLQMAFQEATRLFGVVATTETQIEIGQATNTANSSEAFRIFHETAKAEKLLLILGQTLSAMASATGMGSGTANLQGKVREDVRLWDAYKLGNTVRKGVIEPWMRLNGIKGPVPWLGFGGFDPSQLADMGDFLKSLSGSGLELDDDSIPVVSRHIGITLRRSTPPPAPAAQLPGASPMLALAASGLPPSTIANEAVARDAAAELAQAFSGDLAPLNAIIASSRTTEELLERAGAFMAGYRPHRSQQVIAQALSAHAMNALVKVP